MNQNPLPDFKSEQEEAAWYAQNQDTLLDHFTPVKPTRALKDALGLPSIEDSLPRKS